MAAEAQGSPSKLILERDLQGWSLLERFLRVLDEVSTQVAPSKREDHGLRTLDRRAYFGMFLLGLFNPVVTSMRALCAASALPRVRQLTGHGVVGLSRFSEAQQVFSPQILQPVLAELLKQSAMREVISAKFGRISPQALRVVDSTVWKVIPRMQWAQWRHQHIDQKALRLHVKLRLSDLQPTCSTITTGKSCERAVLRANVAPGEFYIGDRYYGESYDFFEHLRSAGCGFVLRVRNEAVLKVIKPHSIGAEAATKGVRLDAQVMLGSGHDKGPWRVVIFQTAVMKQEAIVVTSEECVQLSAEEVMELYRHRWQVEMFFRWLKCLVPCRHWFAESQQGVTIQVYLALIEALLLAELVEAKPNKRMMELLHWHQIGWASDADLAAGLVQQQAIRKRRAEAKKTI
ncbi:MAG: IS4 family transposase [Prosthecobacter sp.]|nr:IS4 family transposase [Prosthecobacter sp.]